MIQDFQFRCPSAYLKGGPALQFAAMFVIGPGHLRQTPRCWFSLVNTMVCCAARLTGAATTWSVQLLFAGQKESKKVSRLLLSNLNDISRAGIRFFPGWRRTT